MLLNEDLVHTNHLTSHIVGPSNVVMQPLSDPLLAAFLIENR